MLGTALPWLAVFASVGVIFIQRTTITNLQRKLVSTCRTKRSLDLQNSVYVPIYAQISKKAMHRMCMEKHYKNTETANFKNTETMTTTTTAMMTTVMRKHEKELSRSQRKKCSIEVTLSDPRPIGTRPNSIGGAMRDGPVHYLTEFALGYSVLMFPTIRSLNQSEPKSLITLPYPFHGTDNTVFNGIIYYSYSDAVIAFNMNTGETKEVHLNISEASLYENSKSFVDLQADEHGVWALYRQNDGEHLTAIRMHPVSLKILSSWPLSAIYPNRLCNAIIRCGLLYTMECAENNVIVSAAYDFYGNMYVNAKKTVWKGMNGLSSVQYDPRSKAITIFDNGVVYTVSAV